MSSREKILQAISINKPAFIDQPAIEINKADMEPAEAVQQFIKTLESIGGKAQIVFDINTIKEDLQQSRANGDYIVNTIALLGEVNDEIGPLMEAVLLEPVHKAYVTATIGVAENGAVWIYESQMKNRILP